MANGKEYISQEGLEKLKKELEYLEGEKRHEIAAQLKYAKSLGDLSENAEYKEAKDASAALEHRISQLNDIIRRAVIISSSDGGVISLGSIVSIKKEDGSVVKYQIVGVQEANISEGKISNESPLGKVLLGKKNNDEISVESPKGEIKYKVTEVE
jgi:transcription elongation factor GreA